MKSLELVFFDAGGGHRSAANALSEVARLEGRDWSVQLMNLQELLDEMDVFRKLTGIRLQDIYNLMLRKGWTLGSPQMLPLMHGVIRMLHPQQVAMLERYWRGRNLDMVVSVIPNFNRALFQALGKALPGVPMVTILTDMADYPPSFWIEKQSQYLICGTEMARDQALAMGHSPERVFLTSGMILHPKYYQPVEVDRTRDLETLGLDPKRPTALMMFGGEGSAKMLEIARLLNASSLDLQIIAICGKNEKLCSQFRDMPRRIPVHIEGFTREVPKFMKLSDFFIGKPGPGSISEAMIMGLPVIVECNAWTLPQERYNATWVEERGVGIALKSFRSGIVEAVRRMVDETQRRAFTTRVNSIQNRAVFEIPEILAAILAKH
ncbi:MAG: Monogalactosyldiacylglycerol synthase [Bryobacterales bacterium]|nr:Monogalactosyldiacylglycerol synthase [Bryobacterales bacterium]